MTAETSDGVAMPEQVRDDVGKTETPEAGAAATPQKAMWVIPVATCGLATPFCFAYLATTKGTWLDGLWAVLYGFLLGFGVFATGEAASLTVPGGVALAVTAVVGGIHLAVADKRADKAA